MFYNNNYKTKGKGGKEMSKLFLMMGAPGSGKSYWATHHLSERDKYISRDEIRFSFLEENDAYLQKKQMYLKSL